MAQLSAEVSLQASASVSSGAAMAYAASTDCSGDAVVEPVPGLKFRPESNMVGNGYFTSDPSVYRDAEVDLAGSSDVSSDMMFLLYSSLGGIASLQGDASYDAAAEVSLQGDAVVSSGAELSYGAVASIQADAQLNASFTAAYCGVVSLQGDADLSAKALPEDELAIDLYGSSGISGSPTATYAMGIIFVGQSRISAVALLRHPATAKPEAPVAQGSERLLGYQPGREQAPRTDKFVLVVE